jgi:serine/threonine protein kinase
LRELGRGASGAVYLARDEELDRPIALKILHPGHHQKGAEARARAWLEARLAASIRHPGVVAIYDLDEEHHLVAMELCDGGALRERLARGPLAPDEALARAAELLRTLESVHRRGIAHGDLKPGNLLYRTENGELVVVDFGLARLIGETKDEAARGTLAYMAPEQRQGQISPAGDIFAAGVITVELLFGSAALSSWLGDRTRLLRGEARWNGTLPEGLGAREEPLRKLLSLMMATHPAARPSAADAARAFTGL